MANKALFKSMVGKILPRTDTLNHELAPAYELTPESSLAQYAVTGCLNSTFYASGGEQLETVLKLCGQVDPSFIARTAVYARKYGAMKDMPALLCAVLAVRDLGLLDRVFDSVIDNGKMLRNFVQILRSGAVGRKSLGTAPKRLVRKWLENRSDAALFRASVGNDPSLADVIKMVHPKPADAKREAFYGYLIGKEADIGILPEQVRRFEAFKLDKSGPVPDVPFQMLTALNLGTREWKAIAQNAGWQMTRMNLNTFARHGVFNDEKMVKLLAARLRNRDEIARSRVFPYQLMMAYKTVGMEAPRAITEALQDAMETATENVPAIKGRVVVCPDVSGSMTWASATGYRKGSTSQVRCIDVAALAAASIVRKNHKAMVLPFENDVVRIKLNPRDSIMTNAEKLSKIGGGGTNLSAPLVRLNRKKEQVDLVVFISDNESWIDASHNGHTETMRQWNKIKKRNPKARLVCIDIQPYRTTQARERGDILNIGGFTDSVFTVISEFAAGRLNGEHWVKKIEAIEV